MSVLRFAVPPDQALLTLADASGGLSALFALDAHIEHHLGWLREAAEAFGRNPESEGEQMRDARAAANAQLEPIRALRGELAELAADAEAALPVGVKWTLDIVTEHPLPFLPDTLGPRELIRVERSFSSGMLKLALTASQSLGPLRDRLMTFDAEESRGLAERLGAFVAGTEGPPAGAGPTG